MPLRCCAHGCEKSTVGRDEPCDTFPAEPKLRRIWIRAARLSLSTWVSSKRDSLCSEHFEDSDYQTSPALLPSCVMSAKGRSGIV
ncbi:hypothetical protein HPB49_009022 [Dermacentor silvarum]|uniref:Uncharacterized protein n=1 Tax=Dermacentor silvarum TaxID=543639 RepID=A0ACB8DIP2_DERSI|nr:hypothetical protein HPB49_009022 [Dermacentor silvarum]